MLINRNVMCHVSCVILLSMCGVGLVYSDENLEELKSSLLEQEKQIATEQKGQPQPQKAVEGNVEKEKVVYASGKESINKGYIYSNEIKEGKIVYEEPGVRGQIAQLYREASRLFTEGKFDEAKAKLEEIVELSPLHVPARRLHKRILEKEAELSFQDSMIDAKEKMLEVDKAWFAPSRDEAEEEKTDEELQIKTPQQKIIEEKAQQIIPEINFNEAHIRDVLKYLSDISGINIVVDEDLFPKTYEDEREATEVEVTGTESPASAIEEKKPLPQLIEGVDRITISLANIPLIEALKYILSAKGLKYRIDEYAIVVSTLERLSGVEMETRYYHPSAGAGIFTEFAKKIEKNGDESERVETGITRGLKEGVKVNIKDVLTESGVPFPAGSKVFLDKRTGTLIVRNTPQNLLLVEEILKMLDITPFQVEIEARFIEVTQNDAQELGLEWMITSPDYRFGNDKQYRWDNDASDPIYGQFPDPLNQFGQEGISHGERYLDKDFLTDAPYQKQPEGNILSISGVLTKPEFKMILHALDQAGYSNVLSAPKVATLNNQQAQVEVVKEVIYPTEFELTPATTNNFGTVITQPVVTPSAWTTRDVGIILNVTPSVGADKKTINLKLKPEVSKFLKWQDYGIKKGANWNAIPIKQPIFFTQNVDTNVVVHDGETVVLGGLIKEETSSKVDKIPLLGDIPFIGRLFRSESEVTKKTNLIIFVTSNLITPTGDRVRASK